MRSFWKVGNIFKKCQLNNIIQSGACKYLIASYVCSLSGNFPLDSKSYFSCKLVLKMHCWNNFRPLHFRAREEFVLACIQSRNSIQKLKTWMSLRDPGFVPRSKVFLVSNTLQCTPGVFNRDQKLHGLSCFWDLYIHETVQNHSRKISVIGLLNFNTVNISKKCPHQASFSIENLFFNPKKGGVESA